MSVIFLQEDVTEILRNKYVVVMGGSIQRSIYKDLIKLLQGSVFLTDKELRAKGEKSCVNDKLVFKSEATNGIGYREVREYLTDSHLIQFVFMTRCFNAYVESMLNQFAQNDPKPDVIIINSCLWDLTRYGKDAVSSYKENLAKLFKKLSELLPDCFVIWITNPPIATDPKGGVFVPEVEHLKCQMELNVLEANYFARELAVEHGHDVLDMHYYLRYQIHRRAEDGIHWDMTGHRRMSNLILAHLAEAWEVDLPNHLETHYNSLEESESTDFIQSDDTGDENTDAKDACDEYTQNRVPSEKYFEECVNARVPLRARNDNYGQHIGNGYNMEPPRPPRAPPHYLPPLRKPSPAPVLALVPPSAYHRQMPTTEYVPWSVEAQMQKWEPPPQPEAEYAQPGWSGAEDYASGADQDYAYAESYAEPMYLYVQPRHAPEKWHSGGVPTSYHPVVHGRRFYDRYHPY